MHTGCGGFKLVNALGQACPARCCCPRAAAGVPASIRRPDPDTGAALFALLGMVGSGASGQCGPVAAEGEHRQGDERFGGVEAERDAGQHPDLGVAGSAAVSLNSSSPWSMVSNTVASGCPAASARSRARCASTLPSAGCCVAARSRSEWIVDQSRSRPSVAARDIASSARGSSFGRNARTGNHCAGYLRSRGMTPARTSEDLRAPGCPRPGRDDPVALGGGRGAIGDGGRFRAMTAIFISHSSADRVAAEDMKRWLEAQGHTSLFLDFDVESGIKGGSGLGADALSEAAPVPGGDRAADAGLDRLQVVLCRAGAGARAWQGDLFGQGPALRRGRDLRRYPAHRPHHRAGEEGYERLKAGLLERGLDPLDVFDWDPSRPPYPGFMAFEEADAAIFFGRGADIIKTLRDPGRAAPPGP